MSSGTIRSRVAALIGRVQEPSVLDEIIDTLAYEWRKMKGGFHRVEHARSEVEILCGSRILQELTLLATGTYEGRPLTTGIVVGESWAFEGPVSKFWRHWLAMWPEDSRPSIERRAELAAAAALAEGKRSFMVADTFGRIYGIIETKNTIHEVVRAVGGYALTTNRHREVFLFDGNIEPVCHHNGFEWRRGGYIGPLMWVDYWAHYEKENALYDKVMRGDLPVSFPHGRDYNRWFAFQNIIEAMSDRRVSSVLAVCDSRTLKNPDIQALLSPLRPELDRLKWGNIDDNTPVWSNLFRLDGAHFVSKQIRILAVCQRISVPVGPRGSEGTGRAAARFLSEKLGDRGVVIKVSADGPVIVFYKGQAIDRWIGV